MEPEHFKGVGCRDHGNSIVVCDAFDGGDNGGSPVSFHFIARQEAQAGMLPVKPLNPR
jgi:hypothetical protein